MAEIVKETLTAACADYVEQMRGGDTDGLITPEVAELVRMGFMAGAILASAKCNTAHKNGEDMKAFTMGMINEALGDMSC